MDRRQAEAFAAQWVAAWNAHDLELILSHYTDDFEMHSPYIGPLTESGTRFLKGKQKVRAYWQKALKTYQGLRFELNHVLLGDGSVVLVYQGVKGLAAEVFFFNPDQKVYRAHAHYVN